jgi:hypothetical protein
MDIIDALMVKGDTPQLDTTDLGQFSLLSESDSALGEGGMLDDIYIILNGHAVALMGTLAHDDADLPASSLPASPTAGHSSYLSSGSRKDP